MKLNKFEGELEFAVDKLESPRWRDFFLVSEIT